MIWIVISLICLIHLIWIVISLICLTYLIWIVIYLISLIYLICLFDLNRDVCDMSVRRVKRLKG